MRSKVKIISVVLLLSSSCYASWGTPGQGQYHIQTDEGPERYFRYQTDNGQYRKEKRLQDGTVVGTDAWIDALGYLRQKDYIADNQGYRILKSKTVFVGLGRPIDEAMKFAKKVPDRVKPSYKTVNTGRYSNHFTPPTFYLEPTQQPQKYTSSVHVKPHLNRFNENRVTFSSTTPRNYGFRRKSVTIESELPPLAIYPASSTPKTLNSNEYEPPIAVYTPKSEKSSTNLSSNISRNFFYPVVSSTLVDFSNYKISPKLIQSKTSPYTAELDNSIDTQPIVNRQINLSNEYSSSTPVYDSTSIRKNGFEYYLPRHYHEETSSDDQSKIGSFGYIDPFGIRRVIYYNASPNKGFVHRKNNRFVGFNATPYDP